MNAVSSFFAALFGMLLRRIILLFTGASLLKNAVLPQGPTLLFAKHSSHFDTLILWAVADAPLRARLRPVAAADYWGRDFPRRWIARAMLNAVLVDRVPTPTSDPVRDMEKALREGACLLVFPEGSRLSHHELGPFKSGIYRLAKRLPELSLTPVHIANAGRSLPKGDLIPTPVNCHISIGEPMKIQKDEQLEPFILRARSAVLALSVLLQNITDKHNKEIQQKGLL